MSMEKPGLGVVGDFEVVDRAVDLLPECVNRRLTSRATAEIAESTAESQAGGAKASERNARTRENRMGEPALPGQWAECEQNTEGAAVRQGDRARGTPAGVAAEGQRKNLVGLGVCENIEAVRANGKAECQAVCALGRGGLAGKRLAGVGIRHAFGGGLVEEKGDFSAS
jgi:hypothetical protein